MYLMKDIVRDPSEVLRQQAGKVEFPLSAEDQEAMHNMMEYLVISQDEDLNEKYDLRPGVGLAAPQVGISKQFSAILIPEEDEQAWNEDAENEDDVPEENEPQYFFKGVIFNPVIIRQSVKQCALTIGEGCLSVDEDRPGYVHRPYRITVRYQDELGVSHDLKLEGYPAIVFQHEIDHLKGTLYYDHIKNDEPWHQIDNAKYLG